MLATQDVSALAVPFLPDLQLPLPLNTDTQTLHCERKLLTKFLTTRRKKAIKRYEPNSDSIFSESSVTHVNFPLICISVF